MGATRRGKDRRAGESSLPGSGDHVLGGTSERYPEMATTNGDHEGERGQGIVRGTVPAIAGMADDVRDGLENSPIKLYNPKTL